MAALSGSVGDEVIFRLGPTTVQISASADSVLTYKVPFACTILKIKSGVEAETATTVTVDLENGTTDLVTTPTACVATAAIVSGGVEDTPDAGVEQLAAGDILHMDVDFVGTSVDGVWCDVVVARK